jgi:hypothetical protein
MTALQKEEIYKLRLQGLGYRAIARELLLSVEAVKRYCKRHHLNGPAEIVKLNAELVLKNSGLCLCCKNPIRQKKRGRTKKFCSNTCKYAWWKAHQERRSPKLAAIYQYICQHCGRQFSAYGNKQRKYCSHTCYIKSRYWGEEDGI